MTALNKQALLVPERKRHDWSQSVMRDCNFCSQWSLTVKHENGGCICASCCDAEYTEELKSALESAIDRAESAEKRIAELQIARDKCFLSGLKTGWEYGIADDTEGYNREIDDAQAVIDGAAGIQVIEGEQKNG